jgi:lipoprotein-anchoring transpeptidase ErfK/SrfK
MLRSVPLAVACALLAALTSCASGGGPVDGGAQVPTPSTTSAPSTAAPTSVTPTVAATVVPTADPITPPPPPDPCAHSAAAKRVLVDLSQQHLWFCARRHTAHDTAITSGMAGPDTDTPTGRYRIQGRNRNSVLTLNTGATYDVKFWIPFDAPLFGFHDSAWQHFPYGSAKYKTNGSHGCVHLPLKEMRYLYRWAPVGTPVTIRT